MRNTTLTTKTLAGRLGGATILAALVLAGCATHEYVDKQVAGLQAQNNEQYASLNQQGAEIKSAGGKIAQIEESRRLSNQTLQTLSLSFPTGKYDIQPGDEAQLRTLSENLKTQNPNVFLEIEGFADKRGSGTQNMKLGAYRASEVYEYLRTQGIPLNRMAMVTHGEKRAASNTDLSGMQQDRKVVVSVVTP